MVTGPNHGHGGVIAARHDQEEDGPIALWLNGAALVTTNFWFTQTRKTCVGGLASGGGGGLSVFLKTPFGLLFERKTVPIHVTTHMISFDHSLFQSNPIKATG